MTHNVNLPISKAKGKADFYVNSNNHNNNYNNKVDYTYDKSDTVKESKQDDMT